jgi:phospholipid/cholesterol/gamma-HCH transport system substrate-binding protein
MAKPFKFRYVNEIVGGFVLLTFVLLVVGVVLVGRAQSWFEPKITVRVLFPPEGSAGIKKGAEVQILGTLVGMVEEVVVKDDGSMEGIVRIQGRFARFIRGDSKAILKKKFGVAGDAFIEITKGSGPALTGIDIVLYAENDVELLAMAQELVQNVRDAVVPVIDQIRLALVEYTRLAADLRSPTGHVQMILAQVEGVAKGLRTGQGAAGKILSDPKTADQVAESVQTVNTALKDVKAILADVKKATAELPGATLQTRDALYEAEKLLEGIQRHWLLRGYVEQVTPSERVSPDGVGVAGGKEP